MFTMMMKLDDACPICGCNVVVCEGTEVELNRTKIRQHTNGQRWDYRDFLCGQRIIWSPNFNRQEIEKYHPCRNNPAYLAREQARSEIDQQIKALEKKRSEL